MAEGRKEEENQEERGFTVTDRRRSARERAEKAPEPESPKPPPPPKQEAPPKEEAPQEEIPPADFQYLVLFLATQAMLCLGEHPDPTTGEKTKNLPGAKHSIDLLSVIREKTKGNLTENEQQLLENMLYDLRMRYVKATEGSSS